MPFALAGTTITHTGTDTDLSGLAGLAGVVTMTFGGRTIYDIGANVLHIGGSLTSNARNEAITTTAGGNALRVLAGGALTINDQIGTHYLEERWFSAVAAGSRLLMDVGSSLVMNGGWLEIENITANANWADTISIVINGGVFGISGRDQTFNPQTTGLDISGRLILKSMRVFANTDPDRALRNVTCEAPMAAIHEGSRGATGAAIENFAMRGTNIVARPWRDTAARIANAEFGLSYRALVRRSGWGSNNRGSIMFEKDFALRVRGPNGSALEGATTYVAGTNHGSAVDRHGFDTSKIQAFRQLTDAAGETPVQRLRLGVRFTVSRHEQPPISLGKYNNSSDIFDVGVITYPHAVSTKEHVFKGFDTLTIERALADDPMLTEPDRAVVDAYATIDNAVQFYDAAKAWLVDNYTGQPAPLVTRDGGKITTVHDVVVDAAAPQAFAFDGAVITIKTDDFAGVIDAPTVTTLNGATISTTISTVAEVRAAARAAMNPALEQVRDIAALDLHKQFVNAQGVLVTLTATGDAEALHKPLYANTGRTTPFTGDNGPILGRGPLTRLAAPSVDAPPAVTEGQDLTLNNIREGVGNEFAPDLKRISDLHTLRANGARIDTATGEHVLFDGDGSTELSRVGVAMDEAGATPYDGSGPIVYRAGRTIP